ncbi:transposase [Streptomyces griseocarneus]|uniref:transposase n=1 Tax=Streptomyces griseocarneus TaxID=51201 RepID=UPI003557C52D
MSLTDAQWSRIEPLLPGRTPRRGGRWRDHRQVVEAIAWSTARVLRGRTCPPASWRPGLHAGVRARRRHHRAGDGHSRPVGLAGPSTGCVHKVPGGRGLSAGGGSA